MLHFSPHAALRRLTWPCPSRRARLIAVLWIQSLPFACTIRLFCSARRGCCTFEYMRYIQTKVVCALWDWDCRTGCLLSPRSPIMSLSYYCSIIYLPQGLKGGARRLRPPRSARAHPAHETRHLTPSRHEHCRCGCARFRAQANKERAQSRRPPHPDADASRSANGGPRCIRTGGRGHASRPAPAPPPSVRPCPCRHAPGRRSPGGADSVAPYEGA
jgi:hypothetical protein